MRTTTDERDMLIYIQAEEKTNVKNLSRVFRKENLHRMMLYQMVRRRKYTVVFLYDDQIFRYS